MAMTLIPIFHIPVFQPFLQLADLTDLIRGKFLASCIKLLAECGVHTQQLGALDGIRKQVAQNLHIHRRAGANRRALRMIQLRRNGRIGHQPAVFRILLQCIQEEFAGTLEDRINFSQIRFVAAELIAIPQMQAKPSAAGRPHPPVCAVDRCTRAPDIGVMMGHPSSGFIHILCGTAAGYGQILHHLNQRIHTFGQITGFRRPIVHFGIDVDRIFALPRGIQTVIPNPLKVGRLRTGTRAADQQIATKLIVERRQLRIIACRKLCDTLIGRKFNGFARAEIQFHTVEKRLIVRQMGFIQLIRRFAGSGRQRLFYQLLRISGHIVIIHKAGCRRNQQRNFIRLADDNRTGFSRGLTALGHHLNTSLILDFAFNPARIAALAVHDQRIAFLRLHRRLHRRIHSCGEREHARLAGAQTDHNHIIRRTGKHFALILHAAFGVGDGCCSGIQIEYTLILFRPCGIPKIQRQIPYRLIRHLTLRLSQYFGIDQRSSLSVLAVKNQFTDFRNRLFSRRIHRIIRTSGPERIFI